MPRDSINVVRAYINIYEEDKATLEHHYGHGWSAEIRDMIHVHCQRIRLERSMGVEYDE